MAVKASHAAHHRIGAGWRAPCDMFPNVAGFQHRYGEQPVMAA
jgi:hypothetical protein